MFHKHSIYTKLLDWQNLLTMGENKKQELVIKAKTLATHSAGHNKLLLPLLLRYKQIHINNVVCYNCKYQEVYSKVRMASVSNLSTKLDL